MSTFNNGESGSSVRTKINESIEKTDAITSTGSGEIITDDERTKLDGIEEGAQLNLTTSHAMGVIDTTTPVITVNSSNGFGSLGLARTGVGTYELADSDSNFIVAQTICIVVPEAECFVGVLVQSTSIIEIKTYDTTGTLADNLISDGRFKIEIFRP